jgi:biflaviolin synthase
MTEETTTLTGRTRPPVRDWPALDLDGTEFDPVLAELMREGPLTRIRLPYGEEWAWPATRHDDVKLITNDPRFGRAEVTGRQVTRMAPHFKPRRFARLRRPARPQPAAQGPSPAPSPSAR